MKNQQKSEEIHLITGTGKSAFICESVERAMLRWNELGKPYDWTVVRVTTLKDDITPRQMRRTTLKIVRTDDHPLAMSA